MKTELVRLVVDTNIVVRGLSNRNSASGRVLRLCEARQVRMLLSRPVIREYLEVLCRKELTEVYPAITAEAVSLAVARLRYFSDFIDPVRARFKYHRDPDDATFLELAIAGSATHIITYDKDLLSLSKSHSDPGKRLRQRLPRMRILDAVSFMQSFET